jgi:hypothetical protein
MTDITTSIRGPEQLVKFLNGELGFYRSLCALLQKQRDRLARGEEREIPADLEEIGFLQKQIEAGEALLRRARDEGADQFSDWLTHAEVADVVKRIAAMVSRCRNLTMECERLSQERLDSEPIRSDIHE